jgi:hypothetical protein
MLAAIRRLETTETTVTTRDGASARVEQKGDGEVLTVRDRVGRVLFQYDADTGRGVLTMPEGDLRLAAPRGRIELVAAHGIRAVSGGDLELTSATSASLSVEGDEGESAVRLDREGTAIEGGALRVRADESDLSLGDARARAGSLRAAVENAEVTFGTLVRSATRVIDQAENLYQRVSELCEIKAGRLRTLVQGSMWMKGEEVTLLAKKDVRVDGEHINLG